MSKNNSSSNIFPVSKSYNSSPKTEKERSDSSSILFCNNISNNANMVNISLFSENESSCESGVNEKLNLSRVDSCLSRIDSNIHRLDSSISRGDSYDNNKNEEENSSDDNNSSSDIENSNSNIVIHCEEEDENDDNNIEKVLENEKIEERKESDADFFLEKAKSRKPEEDENL